MKRHIPGLHRENQNAEDTLEGVFLVASIGPSTVGIRNDHSTFCGSLSSNLENIRAVHSLGVSTAPPKRFGNSAGS